MTWCWSRPPGRTQPLAWIAAVAFLLASGLPSLAQGHELLNGDVEQTDAQGQIEHWSARPRTGSLTLQLDTADKSQGRQSARFDMGPDGANFRSSVGQLVNEAIDTPTQIHFTADAKFIVPVGKKAVAYFRVYVGDQPQIIKIPISETWTAVRETITLQAGQRISSLDLSAACDAGVTLWLDNLKLTKADVPAADASSHWLQREDVDGDGQEDILLNNPYYALTLLPTRGGSLHSLRIKPSTSDIALKETGLPQGLLHDVFSGDARSASSATEPVSWSTQLDQSHPRKLILALERPIREPTSEMQLRVRKTMVFAQDSPAIEITLQVVDGDGKPANHNLDYAVKNLVAYTDQPTEFFIPDWTAITRGVFRYDQTVASQNQYVRFPPQGWTAVMAEEGPGLVYEALEGNPAELYSWRKNRIATLEWKYGSGALGGEGEAIRYRLIAFHGLPHVDGVMDGAAAAWVVPDAPPPGQSMQAKLLLAGQSKLRTIDLAWRRLPDGPWVEQGQHVVRSDANNPLLTLPMTVAAADPGTYVLRATLRQGQEVGSVVERPVIVGEASGPFTLTATIRSVDHLGSVNVDGAIPLTPDQPLMVTKRLPVASQLVKAMAYTPFDGRVDTRGASGSIMEWRGLSSLAVSYDTFSEDNGMHLTLAPQPFNAIQIRGDWQGKIYADSEALLPPPDSQPPLANVQARQNVWRQTFDEPRVAEKLSFFYQPSSRGMLADVSVLFAQPGKTWTDGELPPLLLYPSQMDEPQGLMRSAMLNHVGKAETFLTLAPTPTDRPVTLAKGQYLHLLTPSLDPQVGIAAVTLTLEMTQVASDSLLVLRLWDPLDPMRENMHAQLRVPGPGRYTITLDAPDMVLLTPPSAAVPQRMDGPLAMDQLWLSVVCNSALSAKGVKATVHRTARDEALAEAAQWRMFILQGMFSGMSENRPWMLLSDKLPTRQEIQTNPAVAAYRDPLLAIMTTAQVMRNLQPDDPVVIQYYDWLYQQIDRRKQLPTPDVQPDGDAPRWAVLLRENWRLISAIPEWWIEHRRAPDGSFGGGVNDDTDLLQTWQCLPMVDDGPKGRAVRQSGIDIADLAWKYTLEEGINRRSLDSLHAYEEGVNQLALNAWWFYGDPFHFERLMECARSTLKLMVTTPDGRVHFGTPMMGIDQARHGFDQLGKSQMFASLFLHPLYEVAMYNRNPQVIDRMKAWGDTWAAYQKPGAFVQTVDIPTGKPAQVFPYQRGPVDEWTAIWQVTGDERFLAPMIMGFKPGEYWGFQPSYGDMPQAAVQWPEPVMTQVRSAFGRSGYSGLLLTGHRQGMESMLEHSLAWFSKYPYMDTAAHQRTDRVLTYHATTMYAAYLGAAPNRNRWVRFNAVSYEGMRGEDFAALVWDAGNDRLRVAIYNFKDQPLSGQLRLWRLDHGQYTLSQGVDADDDGRIDTPSQTQSLTLAPNDTLPLNLPPRQLTVIELTQTRKLDDIRTRADLALSSRTTQLTAAGVQGIVHNIGAAAAKNVTIALLDGQGREVSRQNLGDLLAPIDLQPQHLSFSFSLPSSGREAYQVVIDPDHTTPEIYEPNNVLSLKSLQQQAHAAAAVE